MYRIVASDMDETFLARDGSVPPANIEAIRRLRELGCLFVPASGRPYPSVMGSLRDIPPELMEGSYVMSYNGACINRYGEDEPITATAMDFEKVEALFEYSRGLDVGVHVYQLDGKVWGTRIQPEEHAYIDAKMPLIDFDSDDLGFLRGVPLAKILYVKPDGLEFLHRVAEKIPAELLEGVDVTFSSGRYLELVPAGVSKGVGLARLAKLLGVAMGETIGCGDAENDLSMVEAAGIGVAAANATGGLSAHADYTTKATCDDGILAEVVGRFVEP